MASAVEKIKQAIAAIKEQRVAWLSEKPKVPKPSDATPDEFMAALRDEYRWYAREHRKLTEARNALDAMLADCEVTMQEIESVAALMQEAGERTRVAEQYAEASNG